MSIDRSKPSEVTITINGQVYKTTVYPEIPKLPEGYRVEETKLGLELWHLKSSHCLVVFNDGVFCFNPVYPKDAPAVIAFLQGAR